MSEFFDVNDVNAGLEIVEMPLALRRSSFKHPTVAGPAIYRH